MFLEYVFILTKYRKDNHCCKPITIDQPWILKEHKKIMGHLVICLFFIESKILNEAKPGYMQYHIIYLSF